MKKLVYFLPALLLLIASCNNKKEDDKTVNKDKEETIAKPAEELKSHIGNWKVIAMEGTGMSEETKAEAIKDASIEFRKDGTYTSVDTKEKENGTYQYNETTTELTVTPSSEGSSPSTFTITWKDGHMIMTLGNGATVELVRL